MLEKKVVKQNEEHPNGFDINPLMQSFTMNVILNVGFGVDVDAQNNPDNPYVRHAYGFLTDEDIIGNSNVFMIAGFDTIASTLSWLVYDLVTHPDIQDRLIAEIDEKLAGEEPNYDKVFGMSYLDMIVSETLRMHPVAPKLIRQGSQPMEICGVRIPEGIEIHIPVTTLHFMPEYWEQPEVYNPERCRCLSRHCLWCGLGHRCSLPWKPGTGLRNDTNRGRGKGLL
ncbi:CP3AV-like protein [Mya arenaria]|uniref:CP3AV-like protein n=1 Tax=Mya arenaria TaxID=6604 RepID=A0ABY7ETU0_MYAAR|nr:CP3AV-like protein [Mya arenaria]